MRVATEAEPRPEVIDIEIAAAMAPHAKQLVYEAPNTTQGLNDLYNRIVTDNKAQIESTSWGLCENSSGPAELQTLDNIFKQGAAQGMSCFAAAGDFVLDPAREILRREALAGAGERVPIVRAELGTAAGLIGAGLVAFDAVG